MKLSYNWLKDFVPLNITPQKLADNFTMKVAEVEDIEEYGQDLSKVVVGEILEIRPHPKADKLQLTKVSVGADTLEIVCGAKNIQVGQKVPTALIGAVLPGDFKITKREIRGIVSEGMLASAKELGVGDDAGGIMILDPKAEVGASVGEVTGLADSVLDIAVLPDRSYLLSHIGAARDIAAMRGLDLTMDGYSADGAQMIKSSSILNDSRVHLMDPGLSPRYSMIKLSGLTIGPSPSWLSIRLQRLDIRPVNNLVDLTNYVMMELGQPLHAFDSAKLKAQKITVRPAKEGEKITTLDGLKRDLTTDMLVIADDTTPVAVAGVMGGAESEISDKTTDALIESANFDSISVRKTAQALKLQSDASLRYERGVDPNLTTVALARLVELMPHAGLEEAQTSRLVDEYPAPFNRQPIRFQPAIVKKLTGVDIAVSEQIRILQSIDLIINESVQGNQEDLLVTPPSYRNDLNIPADLVEEIVRLYGYDKIPLSLPTTQMVPRAYDRVRHLAKKTKNILRGAGFTEMETYSFASKPELEALQFDPRQYLELKNPPTPEQSYMRSTLLPNALAAVKKNIANGVSEMNFYELGRTYRMVRGQEYPFEGLRLLVTSVDGESYKSSKDNLGSWNQLAQLLDSIIFHFGLEVSELTKKPFITNKAYHHGRSAALAVSGEDVGYLAEVHPVALSRLGIDRRVTVIDLDFNKLINLSKAYRQYKPVPKFPPVVRDISFILEESMTVNEVMGVIKKAGKPLLVKLELFDKFEGESIGKNKKSLAFHMTYQAKDKTLKDSEIEKITKKITESLVKKGVKIRD